MSAVPASFFVRDHEPRMAGSDASLLTSGRTSGHQDPMRQPQFIRSNTFRWALALTVLHAVCVGVLFGFIYWKIKGWVTARTAPVNDCGMVCIRDFTTPRRLEAIDEKLRQ